MLQNYSLEHKINKIKLKRRKNVNVTGFVLTTHIYWIINEELFENLEWLDRIEFLDWLIKQLCEKKKMGYIFFTLF